MRLFFERFSFSGTNFEKKYCIVAKIANVGIENENLRMMLIKKGILTISNNEYLSQIFTYRGALSTLDCSFETINKFFISKIRSIVKSHLQSENQIFINFWRFRRF